jgi:hypothetical protein
MRKFRWRVAGGVVLWALASPGYGQTAPLSLEIAGVSIALGIPRDQALQLFKAEEVAVIDATRPDMPPGKEEWLICKEGQKDIATCTTVGQLDFVNHALVMAVSMWGVDAKTSADATLALYGAVQDMRKRGFRNCEMNTHARGDNDHTYTTISFSCGRFAYISMNVTKKIGGSSTVDISETIATHDLSGLD